MKRRFFDCLVLLCLTGALFLCVPAFAEDSVDKSTVDESTITDETIAADGSTDEDSIFSGGDTIVSQEAVVNDKTGEELKEKHIGLSGEIDTSTTYTDFSSSVKDWTGENGTQLQNEIDANFSLDVRLQKGIKGFINFEADYFPALTARQKKEFNLSDSTKNYTSTKVNEFFVDANLNNKVYFRTGKQVLQWGTGYLWNPTDMINIEGKDFMDMGKVREGTFGEKIQVPWGVKRNLYFFIGMEDSQTTGDTSLAGKYEFLVGETEMSFSAWSKSGYKPVWGYDFSGAKVGDLNFHGEVGFYPADDKRRTLNYETLDLENESGDWNPRACLGFTTFFDKGAIKDGISVTTEFYYNAAGYDKNIIQRIAGETDPNKKQTAIQHFLVDDTLYQPYMNSMYYMAVFTSVKKFMHPDLALNINAIANLVDHSSTLTTGISYKPALTDFTLDFKINGYFGDPNTEATFLGNNYSLYLGTSILF